MLEIARRRHPDVTFHQADMAHLQLGTTFDAVICMFSSIGYVKTVEGLNQTLRAFARHTVPGGVVIVDGWLGRSSGGRATWTRSWWMSRT